jgi:hypothetical protein
MFISWNVRKTNAVAIAKKEYNKKSVCLFFSSQNLKVDLSHRYDSIFSAHHIIYCVMGTQRIRHIPQCSSRDQLIDSQTMDCNICSNSLFLWCFCLVTMKRFCFGKIVRNSFVSKRFPLAAKLETVYNIKRLTLISAWLQLNPFSGSTKAEKESTRLNHHSGKLILWISF